MLENTGDWSNQYSYFYAGLEYESVRQKIKTGDTTQLGIRTVYDSNVEPPDRDSGILRNTKYGLPVVLWTVDWTMNPIYVIRLTSILKSNFHVTRVLRLMS